jgi:NAD(P)-dependent dehydrogenase (short-subunit alcohol dehydrogenase family)
LFTTNGTSLFAPLTTAEGLTVAGLPAGIAYMDQTRPTVLVTGASSGIGLATAHLLAAEGYRVLAGVRCDRGRCAIEDCGAANLTPVWLDVTQPEHVDRLIPEIRQLSPGGLYALVNNAGIGPPSAVELTDLDELRRILEVNTLAPLRMIQACLPMLREGRGRIVNISSMNGTISLPMVGAYSASKFALEALSVALRIELRPWRIPISLIRPGQIGTAIFDKARAALEERTQAIPPELVPGYGKLYERAAKFNERGATSATPPATVARIVLKALRARRPKLHYIVGADAWGLELARAALPTRWLDSLIAAIAGAKNGKR